MFAEILFFLIFISLFFLVILMITCISCFGLTSMIKSIINNLNISSYDQIYHENSAPINTQCFICIQRVKNEVVATCNHSYCAQCIIDYIKSKPQGPIDCPACRKKIYVLLRKFNLENDKMKNFKQTICGYNYKHSQQPSFFRSITEFGTIVKHLPLLLSREGIKFLFENTRARNIILMFIYTLSPVDLIPEIIFGPIGLIDDAASSLLMIQSISSLLINFVRSQGRIQSQLN